MGTIGESLVKHFLHSLRLSWRDVENGKGGEKGREDKNTRNGKGGDRKVGDSGNFVVIYLTLSHR
jgi:hypothetical protein